MGAWGDLPTWAIAAIALLGLIQLGLQAFALSIALRTPPERLLTGRRWLWIVVLALGIVGAIVFLAAARKPTPAPDLVKASPGPDQDKARRAVDLLYGSPPADRDRSSR